MINAVNKASLDASKGFESCSTDGGRLLFQTIEFIKNKDLQQPGNLDNKDFIKLAVREINIRTKEIWMIEGNVTSKANTTCLEDLGQPTRL